MTEGGYPTQRGVVHVVGRCAPCNGPVVLFASWEDDRLLGWCTVCENASPLERPETRASLERLAPDGVYLPLAGAVPEPIASAPQPIPAGALDLAALDVLAELSVLRGTLVPEVPAGWRLFSLGLLIVLFVGIYQLLSAVTLSGGGWSGGWFVAMGVGSALVAAGLALRRRAATSRLPPARVRK